MEIWIINFLIIYVSHLIIEGCVVYTDLCEEQVLFEGEGDPQFDVYRKMKETNRLGLMIACSY